MGLDLLSTSLSDLCKSRLRDRLKQFECRQEERMCRWGEQSMGMAPNFRSRLWSVRYLVISGLALPNGEKKLEIGAVF
jgi:hypothetical protein